MLWLTAPLWRRKRSDQITSGDFFQASKVLTNLGPYSAQGHHAEYGSAMQRNDPSGLDLGAVLPYMCLPLYCQIYILSLYLPDLPVGCAATTRAPHSSSYNTEETQDR